MQKESLFITTLRAFLKSFFSLLGFFSALIVILMCIGIGANLFTFTSSHKPRGHIEWQANENQHINTPHSLPKAPVILQINVKGPINTQMSESIKKQLLFIENSPHFKETSIKGILLYIDSPGGDYSSVNHIFTDLFQFKHRHSLPIYAYTDGLCASGGMYLACIADKIYASKTSLVGSIGVILQSFNVNKGLDLIGIQPLTITSGKNKDNLNPFKPYKEQDIQHMQDITNFLYENFVDLVANHRDIDKEKLKNEYGAKIFIAPEAQKIGLIDKSNASYIETLKDLRESLDIETDQYLVAQIKTSNVLNQFFEKSINSLFQSLISYKHSSFWYYMPKNGFQ